MERPRALDPGSAAWGMGRRTDGADGRVTEVDESLFEPVRRDDAVGIDERNDLSLGHSRSQISEGRDGDTGRTDHRDAPV